MPGSSALPSDNLRGRTGPVACESVSEQKETEEDEAGSASDTAPMLPERFPDGQASALMPPGWVGLPVRGLGTLLLPGQALAGLLLRLLLPATVFLLALLPAAAIVYVGFLCHSRVSEALRGQGGGWLGPWQSGVLQKCGALGLWVTLPPSRMVPSS